MAGVNQVFSLADDVARYVKACGKRSILECKPMQGKINPKELGVIFPNSQSKYMQRQLADIEKFGKREFRSEDELATKAMDFFTPHRRLTKKPCSLSDAPYFIKEFEKNTGERFLPANWAKISEAEKVDYIVHERYNQLVASRCMDAIKDAPVEHCFSIRQDGEIFSYRKGGNHSVMQLFKPDMVSVHNHPSYKNINLGSEWAVDIPVDTFRKNTPLSVTPHSDVDISNIFKYGGKSYVVDANGNKFLLESRNMPNNEHISEIFRGMYHRIEADMNFVNSTQALELKQKLIELNTRLHSLDKNSNEYKQLAKEFEKLAYQTHQARFDEKHFELLVELVNDFSEAFSLNGKGGMRLSQLT